MPATAANDVAAEFLASARNEFAGLARRGGTVTHDYNVAGLKLRIEVAKGLFDNAVHRALAHLAAPPFDDPDLTISAWDSESTGLPPLAPAWTKNDYGHHGLISGFNDARFHTAVQFDPLIMRMLDRESRHAVYWTRAARELPYWEIGAPLRPLLHEWLRGTGRVPVHGGAVGYPDGGVFLAGAGGSGKSNVALSCLQSDLLYLSDDFCVLTDAPEWRAHSLYGTGKIAARDLVRHPRLAPHVSNAHALDREKALFFANEAFPEKLIRTMPLRAIVMPQVVGRGASEIVPAGGAAAQRAIAMSTIELSRWTGASTFSDVARFVRALPCFSLRVGDDLANVPGLIAGLLSDLRRAGERA